MAKHSRLTQQLVRDGLQPPKGRRFADYPPALQAAVNAYDEARRTVWAQAYGSVSQPMSDANKASIAPMIAAAIQAYAEASARSAA